MEQSLNILIVEDNPGDVVIIKELIKSSGVGFSLAHASTLRDTMILCEKSEYDIILLDLGLPDSLGLETLKRLHAKYDRSPLVVMTGLDDEDIALQALREGAQDYLVKNRLTSDGIIRTIKYSIERKKINDIHKQYAQRFSILSAATAALNECDDVSSVFRIICANIRMLLYNAGVFAIEFPDKETARISGIEWLEPWFDKIYRLTGFDLKNPVFSLGPNTGKLHEIFVDKKLMLIKGGLYESCAGLLEMKTCLDLERLLNINFIYSIGFHQHHIFYGGFMIFSRNPIGNDDRNVIETISNQTALNIHRRTIEKHLRISEERFRKLNKALEEMVKERTSDLELLNQQLKKELNDRIQAELALKKNEVQLKELNATKDKFFNIVAHDLKNPFTSLLGSSELLFQNIGTLDQDNVKKLAVILNDSAKSGYAILQNLLDWSRSQTGMLKINPERINLKNLIEENIINLELFSSNKEIIVKADIPGNLYLNADKNMINTVLRNLLSNALKFSFRKGVVEVRAYIQNGEAQVSVRDSGTGISADNLDKLFRIDAKYSMPGTENEQGTGLGLKLCKEFIEKQGGRITVESRENIGSEFKFSIPGGDVI